MKRRMFKKRRIFALLLAVVMVLSVFDVTDARGDVSPETQETDAESNGLEVGGGSAVSGNDCGSNASWVLSSDGTLTISGEGEM